MDFYPLPNFRRTISIKEMLLCELLCQAQVISDQLFKLIIDAANAGTPVANLLRNHAGITHGDLVAIRKIASDYLADLESVDESIVKMRTVCANPLKLRPITISVEVERTTA